MLEAFAMSSPPRVAVDARVLVDAPAGVGYYTRALLERLAARGNVSLTALSPRAVATFLSKDCNTRPRP